MNRIFRLGAVGALMDEYERAALELQAMIESFSDSQYEKMMDNRTEDENCRSVQTILSHVVSSAYSYADYLRELFDMASTRPPKRTLTRTEAVNGIRAALDYTIDTLNDHWEMSEEEIIGTQIHSRWGVTYDMEQLLEHAIVHILRHRRQIEKFLR